MEEYKAFCNGRAGLLTSTFEGLSAYAEVLLITGQGFNTRFLGFVYGFSQGHSGFLKGIEIGF